MTAPENALHRIASAAAQMAGLALVAARLVGGGKFLKAEILLERPDGTSPTLDECTSVSKAMSRELEAQDPIKGRYTLEVGSAGLDRPLFTVADYTRFVGRHVHVKFTGMQTSGYNSFQSATGIIVGAEGKTVTLQLDTAQTPQAFALADIHFARLAPTQKELMELMKPKKSPQD